MIPLRLKFEAEKARYANLIAVIIMLVLYTLIMGGIEYLPEAWTENAAAFFQRTGRYGNLDMRYDSSPGYSDYFLFVQQAHYGEERILRWDV